MNDFKVVGQFSSDLFCFFGISASIPKTPPVVVGLRHWCGQVKEGMRGMLILFSCYVPKFKPISLAQTQKSNT